MNIEGGTITTGSYGINNNNNGVINVTAGDIKTDISNQGTGINNVQKEIEKIMQEELTSQKQKGRIRKTIRVMIVGIPNVGKSSFINRISKKTTMTDKICTRRFLLISISITGRYNTIPQIPREVITDRIISRNIFSLSLMDLFILLSQRFLSSRRIRIGFSISPP